MSEQPAARAWYRLGSADVVFLILILVIFQAARGKMLSDPGLGWHLRNIDAMIAERGWLHTDPFSQPRDGAQQEWRTNQWLGELPFWLGEQWAGKEGVAAVATLILALTLRLLYSMLLRAGLPWPLAAVWVCIAALGTSCSWIARPNLFTMLFVMLTAQACIWFHEGRCSWRRLLWLLPLFAAWANMHGGFIAGFLVLIPTLFIEGMLSLFASTPEERNAARMRAGILTAICGGCFLATLINPYGLSLYPWIVKLLGNPFFMTLHEEWKPTPFNGAPAYPYELCVLLFPFVCALSTNRPSLVELALAVLWLHLALTGFRYMPIWVLIAVPVMARASYGIPWVATLIDQKMTTSDPSSLFARGAGPVPWRVWSLAFALAFFGGSKLLEGRFARLLPEIVATEALDQLVQMHEREPNAVIFHSYNWGGYLTWQGWKQTGLRNWIDDRNEVQGEEHIKATFAILAAEPGWEEKLNKAKVRFVCIERGVPLEAKLREKSGEWEMRYEDDYAVIFGRRAPDDR